MFSYDHVAFRYDPFPIGLATPIMKPGLYEQMVSSFPPLEIFESFEEMGKKGRKYTLSEKENSKAYLDFVNSSPLWRDFYAWIKSKEFPYSVMEMLRQHDIDLGYRYVPPARRLSRQVKNLARGRHSPSYVPLKARFEFSALPADGGHLVPHTDAPTKIVTMIVSNSAQRRVEPWLWRWHGRQPAQGRPLPLQSPQPLGRLRGHGSPAYLSVPGEPGGHLREDLQLLAFRPADDRGRFRHGASDADHQHRGDALRAAGPAARHPVLSCGPLDGPRPPRLSGARNDELEPAWH